MQDRKQAVRLHAIHAMHERFELADTNAAILVDATNAFNSLNQMLSETFNINALPSQLR